MPKEEVFEFPNLGGPESGLQVISKSDEKYACAFCKTSQVDELTLGPLYFVASHGLVTHYFCMLQSAGLSQKGTDHDGILGFLPEDISKELRRATRLKCSYCHTIGASIGCCDKKCRYSFHFPCGLKNGANYQFAGNFETYCEHHSRKRKWSDMLVGSIKQCPICLNLFGNLAEENIIVGNCCKSAAFHKDCIQQLALSAGYFFKCPTCGDKNFAGDMKIQGIFVPEQDAAWEREPNAYDELLYQYSKCDAVNCECPKGRTHSVSKGAWVLARCRICGASGTHRQCGRLKRIAKWACSPCLEIEQRTKNKQKKAAQATSCAVAVSEVAQPPPPEPVASTSKAAMSALTNATEQCRSTPSVYRRRSINDPSSENGNVATCVNKGYIINPHCFDYFPHSKLQLAKYLKGKGKEIPDWRNYTLRVNLLNIFSGVTKEVTDGKVAAAPGTAVAKSGSVAVAKRAIRKASGEKRGGRKPCSWQKGVVKKKKKQKPPVPLFNESENKQQPQSAPPLPPPPNPSASSSRVLEGIHKASNSLMKWMQPIATTSKDTVKVSETAAGVKLTNPPDVVNKSPEMAHNGGGQATLDGSEFMTKRSYDAAFPPLSQTTTTMASTDNAESVDGWDPVSDTSLSDGETGNPKTDDGPPVKRPTLVSFSDGEEQERRLSLSSNPGGNSQKLPSAAPVSSIKLNDAPPAVASTSKPNHGQSQESGSHEVDLSKVKSEPEALEEKPKISVNPETKPEASAEMEVEREVNRLEELFRTKANPAELQAKLRILKTMCPELFQLKDDEPGGGTAGK